MDLFPFLQSPFLQLSRPSLRHRTFTLVGNVRLLSVRPIEDRFVMAFPLSDSSKHCQIRLPPCIIPSGSLVVSRYRPTTCQRMAENGQSGLAGGGLFPVSPA